MGIIGLIIFVIIACVYTLFTEATEGVSWKEENQNPDFSRKDARPSQHVRPKSRSSSSFEPSDSVYDENEDEHEVDDDGYCEECDDYHE
ncbi:MAG: hypothetical protein IIW08_10655 [Clostridia bacterium]|nr:hypothetical protein [Clostridia bacterium]